MCVIRLFIIAATVRMTSTVSHVLFIVRVILKTNFRGIWADLGLCQFNGEAHRYWRRRLTFHTLVWVWANRTLIKTVIFLIIKGNDLSLTVILASSIMSYARSMSLRLSSIGLGLYVDNSLWKDISTPVPLGLPFLRLFLLCLCILRRIKLLDELHMAAQLVAIKVLSSFISIGCLVKQYLGVRVLAEWRRIFLEAVFTARGGIEGRCRFCVYELLIKEVILIHFSNIIQIDLLY
jgi:hypothetical protein